jgi:hypothetical protein
LFTIFHFNGAIFFSFSSRKLNMLFIVSFFMIYVLFLL